MKVDKIKLLISENQLDRLIEQLYRYYPKTRALVLKYGGTEDDARDVFQDALILFIDKLKTPDFELTCKPETFIYSVCFNLWRVAKRRQEKGVDFDQVVIPDMSDDGLESFVQKEQQFEEMDSILSRIGERCKQVLGLYYLRKKSMKEIADTMGFSSEQVAKNQKYKCLEKAKTLARDGIVEHNSMK